MSEIPIALKIEPSNVITMDILRSCRRCGFLFSIDNPYNANHYRCKKCLSTKTIMKDFLCIIH